jgi:hypothetical protein
LTEPRLPSAVRFRFVQPVPLVGSDLRDRVVTDRASSCGETEVDAATSEGLASTRPASVVRESAVTAGTLISTATASRPLVGRKAVRPEFMVGS